MMTDVSAEVVDPTRVFVSGLPSSLTTDQLASHFRTQYKVTDAHVFPERRIGFVGFHDAETARNAVKYFNRTYIRMSKISVDLARPVEVKHNRAGQAVPVSNRDSGHGAKRSREVDGSQEHIGLTTSNIIPTSDRDNKKRKRDDRDDGEQARAEPQIVSEQMPSHSLQEPIESNDDGNAVEDALETIQPASDSDWLRGRTSRLLDLVSPEDESKKKTQTIRASSIENMSDGENMEDVSQPGEDIPQTQQVPNARLFIRNLAFGTTEDDLIKKFAEFGKVQEAHLVKDMRSSTSKGMAFLQFSESEAAERALQSMDGAAFHGRLLHILPASDKREQGLTDFDISKMPLKKQKALRRKLEANTATFSWNSLYMNPDAVISSIAQRLGVAKSEILDPTSADAAVKQAHAETQVIAETKEYFRTHGVNIDALKSAKRDDRSLLLKNFPFGTTETELRDILEPFGQVSRFMIPPAGTMAIVQFVEPYFATQALKGLAYKNIKGSVLYLEKAPQGLLDEKVPVPVTAAAAAQDETTKDESNTGTTATVFIRNLNFSTTTPRLNEIFSPLSGFLSARVKTRTDPKRPGEILSMGFGFVEFKSKSFAESAIAAMNGYRLDGHNLLVKLSTKTTDVAEERKKADNLKKKDANKTKILIKNLPFQASRKDVRSLFAQYGELKTVRVPKKFDNTSRGFGFAEFVTAKEAQNAMEALSDTHLLGRRLVLDFASEETIDPEDEINALEKKMEQQRSRFSISRLTAPGRKKFSVENEEDA